MKHRVKKTLISAACCLAFMQGAQAASLGEMSLTQIKKIDVDSYEALKASQKQDLRVQGIEDIAYRIGAQKGLYDAVRAFEKKLESKKDTFDVIFDFRRLMTLAMNDESEVYLLPAVVMEIDDQIDVEQSGRTLKVAGKTYRILEQERLVTAPPTWWDYLYIKAEAPREFPPAQLMPRTDEERRVWEESIDSGYQAGLDHAHFELNNRVTKLERDYTGMQRYLRLFEQGMADNPVVVARNEQVRGDSRETVLRESTYRITAETELNQRIDDWKPANRDDVKGAWRDLSKFHRVIKIDSD